MDIITMALLGNQLKNFNSNSILKKDIPRTPYLSEYDRQIREHWDSLTDDDIRKFYNLGGSFNLDEHHYARKRVDRILGINSKNTTKTDSKITTPDVNKTKNTTKTDIIVEMVKNGVDIKNFESAEIPVNEIHKIWRYL